MIFILYFYNVLCEYQCPIYKYGMSVGVLYLYPITHPLSLILTHHNTHAHSFRNHFATTNPQSSMEHMTVEFKLRHVASYNIQSIHLDKIPGKTIH